MRYYLDTEFDGHRGALLSLALVREDGWSCHYRTGVRALTIWVIENVEPLMDSHRADLSSTSNRYAIGALVADFIGRDQQPVIIADSPVDIGRFCEVLSTGPDGEWRSVDYPLMTFEVHDVDAYPTTLAGAVQHNAWWDAMALRHMLTAQHLGAVAGTAIA